MRHRLAIFRPAVIRFKNLSELDAAIREILQPEKNQGKTKRINSRMNIGN